MNPAQAIMAGSMNSITGNPVDIITGPLEKHFPVSSGTDHREKEKVRGEAADLPVYEQPTATEEPINVSAVIARRIGAQQILTNNPHDAAAQRVLEECDMKLKGWTQRSRKPGKFTGERGVRMDKKEIAGAIETWVRKDYFYNLMPVSGGIGMRMMQNMGWKEGTPLGKKKEGYVAPIIFDVKVGRTGLASIEEQPQQRAGVGGPFGGYNLPKRKPAPIQNVNGKHPVSALSEICTKKHMGQPEYTCVFEGGASHNKTFLIKCTVQNTDYQPSVASSNKKHAKAQAALTALKILGFE